MNLAERKVLNLLHSKKVTTDEGADLIDAIRAQIDAPTKGSRLTSKFKGDSRLQSQLDDDMAEAAAHDGHLLVEGERGTGKMMISRTIHYNSNRADKQILALDATSELVEEELFGVESGKKGERPKRGLLDVCRGGTVVLDMMPHLPPATQKKLYAFLETGQFKRVNGTKTCSSDVRVVGLSNPGFSEHMEEGRFDKDLFDKLAQNTILAPALRDRLEDLPALVQHFVSVQSQSDARIAPGVPEEVLAKLTNHDWPGNVMELSQVVMDAVANCNDDVLAAEDVKVGED